MSVFVHVQALDREQPVLLYESVLCARWTGMSCQRNQPAEQHYMYIWRSASG